MELDKARDILRTGAGMFERQAEAAFTVLSRLDDIEARCQKVIGGYMPHRRADEVARWILTGNAEGAVLPAEDLVWPRRPDPE